MISLTNSIIKDIRRLALKKYRDSSGLFLAEGTKVVESLIHSFNCKLLLATNEYLKNNYSNIAESLPSCEICEASLKSLSRASLLNSPPEVMAVFEKRPETTTRFIKLNELSIALDGIQDPGNMGTIIRIAGWFGIKQVFTSYDCADVYSPKVVQATMGALADVDVHTVSLIDLIGSFSDKSLCAGTFLEGDNIYKTDISKLQLLVMGNEGHGISKDLTSHLGKRLHIPSYSPTGAKGVESLNVGVATAICCSEIRRQQQMQ